MKEIISKVLVTSLLVAFTIVAYGACFHGWFLAKPLDQPVSLREGSAKGGPHGYGYFAGRTHYGGGYGRGK